MFRRLRLVGRGEPPARAKQMRQPEVPTGARVMTEGKALIAAALSNPPAWTNSLPMADPGGRAANARAIVPIPSRMSVSGAENDARIDEQASAKGGQQWRSSTAPR